MANPSYLHGYTALPLGVDQPLRGNMSSVMMIDEYAYQDQSDCGYKPLTMKGFGSRGYYSSQLPRILDGFTSLGVTEVADGQRCDFIYANDSGGYADAVAYKKAYAPNAKVILNVLDIPEWLHSGYSPYNKTNDLLSHADAITTISSFVQSQLHRYFPKSSPYIVHNPVKDVSPDTRLSGAKPYPYRALLAGRLNDPAKRAALGINALVRAGFKESEVAIVGSENPGWGTYLGVVTDTDLNNLYNSVDYVMSPGHGEGLSLVPLEGAICGAIPILCYDLPTITEMPFPRYYGCWPSVESLAQRLFYLEQNPDVRRNESEYCMQVGEQLRVTYSGGAVAGNIVAVYHKIQSKS